MKAFVLSVVLFAGLLQAAECWKQIGDEDAAKAVKPAGQNPYNLEGDFNGDGKVDKASVEVSCDNKTLAVFAHTSLGNGKFKKHLLTSLPLNEREIYLKKVEAGVYYSVFNVSDYKEAKEKIPEGTTIGETKVVLELKSDAIGVKNPESSLVVYYWYKKGQKFNHISLED